MTSMMNQKRRMMMSKYECPLNFVGSGKVCYAETCCFDCAFMENDGDYYPCNQCSAIGGKKCMYKEESDVQRMPQPHERC